jgi:bifunctional non-homologous end joining protein LigD
MADRLTEYRRKRDAARTPEPVPAEAPETSHRAGPAQVPAHEKGHGDTYVIQQHHARSLHWDLRLERDGVLVSWAVPRGLPKDPARNHLAVHTEDHPLEYLEFSGEIPAGEYGAGTMKIHDRGTYSAEKWRDDEVIFTLDGPRSAGRYVLFQTRGKDWMIHRMDGPPPGWSPMPEDVAPMVPTKAARLPADDAAFGYELDWPGTRALAAVSGGRLVLLVDGTDVVDGYPELRAMAEALAPTECLLDGVVVGFGTDGRVGPPRDPARRKGTPVQYLATDVLWLDGVSTVDSPYAARRERLAGLNLAGAHWQTPPYFTGGGRFAREAAREQRVPGVLAKRLDAPYRPGQRTREWLAVPAR